MTDDISASRNRLPWALATLGVAMAGLASRLPQARFLPSIITDFAGDTLWALMVYCLFVTACPRFSPQRIAAIAFTLATAIEISQLFRPEWLESIRNLPGMRLVLGYGFLWSDLVCYSVGILAGWQIDQRLQMSGNTVGTAGELTPQSHSDAQIES